MKNIEIERKWLIGGFPDLKIKEEALIEQSYISFEPEIRIRRRSEEDGRVVSYKITFKSNGDMERIELERNIDRSMYNDLLKNFCNNNVKKHYRSYNYKGLKLEVSLVDNSFYYAEIEFDNIENANSFVEPEWFGKEVTCDKSYKMKNYAKNKQK